MYTYVYIHIYIYIYIEREREISTYVYSSSMFASITIVMVTRIANASVFQKSSRNTTFETRICARFYTLCDSALFQTSIGHSA